MGKIEGFQAQVKKVVELTKCSSEDAAYVLNEYENDVDQAVNAIFDQPDVNMWKENKKKTKRNEEFTQSSTSNRRGGNRGRGDGGTDRSQNYTGRGGGPNNARGGSRRADKQTGGAAVSGERKDKSKNNSQFPQVDSFSLSALNQNEDDINWKNGPLVFEPSVQPTSVVSNQNVQSNESGPSGGNFGGSTSNTNVVSSGLSGGYNSSVYESAVSSMDATGEPKKLSFAAVAAQRRKPPINCPPMSLSSSGGFEKDSTLSTSFATATPSNTTSQTPMANVNREFTDKLKSDPPLSFSSSGGHEKDSMLSIPFSTATPSNTTSQTPMANVNREFTDKLKSDIGIGLSHPEISQQQQNIAYPNPLLVSGSNAHVMQEQHVVSPQTRSKNVELSQASPILDFISNSDFRVAPHNSFGLGVEFLTGGSPSGATDFQFGFQQLDLSSAQSAVIDRIQHQSQQQQNSAKAQDSSNVRGNAALSFTDPCSLEYPSGDFKQSGGIAESLFNTAKSNGTSHLSQQSLPPQQVTPTQPTIQQQHLQNLQQHTPLSQSSHNQQQQLSHHTTPTSLQQPPSQQTSYPSAVQQSTPQQQASSISSTQVPQSTQQHSLQQQQQQMYTAATAQFPGYGFPYLYSPVANMRDVEQFAALTPFPYMNQLDHLQLGPMLGPPSLTAQTGNNSGNSAQTGNNATTLGSGGTTSAGTNSSQNHHQLSNQQQAQSTTQSSSISQLNQQQQHRGSMAPENKFQSQLQPGGNSSNSSLPALAANIPFQGLNSASQQTAAHQNRSQTGGANNIGSMNSSSTTGNSGVAPPPGFSAPHFMPQQNLQSLFHMPSYPTHTPMPFPLLFPGGGPQQQQSQQRQPQLPQSHYNQQQHLLQSQNHHQPPQPQRHAATAAAAALGMDHVSFMDMAKFPNSTGNSNSNLQGLSSAPFQGNAFGIGGGSAGGQGQPLHRNQSLNQANTDW